MDTCALTCTWSIAWIVNGREIKNTVKTARLLASQKGTPLAMEHVATVLRVRDNGSPVGGNTPARRGLSSLILLPLRVLASLFQELLVLIIHRLHHTDLSKKEH